MPAETERKIVSCLNRDARKSYREIARETGVSVPAVIQTIRKLEEAGAIKGYIPVLDPEYFGFGLMAVILMRFTQGKLLETQQKIAEDRRVLAVFDVTGDWDSVVIGCFLDRQDLNQFIKKVLSIKYIDRTVTQLVLNVVKNDPRVPL
ncbi:MAG: Transcriptional regulator, AsnC family [Candidatus Saccharicenans subterraneus]|uniref:Transcriptional regulator, AsnC family n=1 Tax=Candidatus Saccharicenans subterraneus TaxID=2508984 RepID=A0A3E2BK74_9BACT|nr:MAG: Transcriptional regulator, AsnC family [Candidatus Saccharicenans subterraneum]